MMKALMKLKEWWAILLIVVSIGSFAGWLYVLDVKASDGKKKADRLEIAIVQMSEIIKNSNAKLEGFLTAMGIDPEKAQKWSHFQKAAPRDTLGHVIIGEPWVEVTEDLSMGVKYKVVDSTGATAVDTLWNFVEENAP